MAPNEIFQYSLASALMDGVADGGLPLGQLLAHGDHGLGTFRHMDGEMVVLHGVVYHMTADGAVAAVDPARPDMAVQRCSPFAMLTHFQPVHTTAAVLADKADLAGLLSILLPDAHNLFLAVRVTGAFHSVTVRTVGGQRAPHEGLAAVGAHQTAHTWTAVAGTIVGFRAPAYMQGISVAGDHLHFLSEDKSRGGHLLALVADGEVTVEVAPIAKFHLELPVHDDDFNEAALAGDGEGIAKVEG